MRPAYRPMRAFVALLAALPLACTSARRESHVYKLYPGPVRPPEALALLRLGDAPAVEIDGRAAQRGDWSEVALLPGTHRIRWRMTPGGSMSQGAEPLIAPGGIEVTFVAGHAYTLRAGHARKTYRLYLWIEDAGSATLVAGERPP